MPSRRAASEPSGKAATSATKWSIGNAATRDVLIPGGAAS